jgi:hypothetical protein
VDIGYGILHHYFFPFHLLTPFMKSRQVRWYGSTSEYTPYITSWWKNQPWLVRVGVHCTPHPLFTLVTITYKDAVLQLRGQIHSLYFISTPICTLWAAERAEVTPSPPGSGCGTWARVSASSPSSATTTGSEVRAYRPISSDNTIVDPDHPLVRFVSRAAAFIACWSGSETVSDLVDIKKIP